MQRVLVIGSSGAGKSHFSKRLAERTGLPLVHLDDLYWLPNWERRHTPEGWLETLRDLLAKDAWILDGNYPNSLMLRAERADLVVALEYPRTLCLYRALIRAWLNRRPDNAVLQREPVSRSQLRNIWRYPKTVRSQRQGLAEFPNLRVVTLRNDREANRFLDSLGR